ncbi:MAG: Sec-independent protein translocase protein TatB [Burkholderiales bacterium]|nr:Sec-independent protein translocase protein TatB [Burkholderiales bacterium]
MFGISFSEIILISIIAVIVFGPEQLPTIAKKLGSFIREIRNFRSNITNQIYEQTGIENLQELKEQLHDAVNQIRGSVENNTSYINESNIIYQEIDLFIQPELDFDRQPELFDE